MLSNYAILFLLIVFRIILLQIFIKKVTREQDRKSLKLIDIDCVASSIALRGLEIIPTASSYVFKYLSGMFATLSESLEDKYLRSYLVQESNFWKVIPLSTFVLCGNCFLSVELIPSRIIS